MLFFATFWIALGLLQAIQIADHLGWSPASLKPYLLMLLGAFAGPLMLMALFFLTEDKGF